MTRGNKYSTLKKEWYAKLKESGFTDIEDKTGSVGRGAPRITDKSPLQIEVIQYYYHLCSTFLAEYDFNTELEKTIWSYYCEGLHARDIEKILKNAGIKEGTHYVTIWKIIKRFEKLMKAQYLTTTCQNS